MAYSTLLLVTVWGKLSRASQAKIARAIQAKIARAIQAKITRAIQAKVTRAIQAKIARTIQAKFALSRLPSALATTKSCGCSRVATTVAKMIGLSI